MIYLTGAWGGPDNCGSPLTPLPFTASCRVIAEGIVDKPADLDVATVMSMGFPATKVSEAQRGA